jgi:hypothetical protein
VEPEAVATAQQLTWFGWTPSTSEEGLVISCSEGSLVSKFECSGSYCDNIRAFCQPAVSVSTNHYWTNWFSEESGGNGSCGEGYWVTGFSCKGSYCDSLSVECSNAPGFTYTDCYYTGWMSEENGGRIEFQPGYYARSVYCNGSYCDNMRFKVCRAIAEES